MNTDEKKVIGFWKYSFTRLWFWLIYVLLIVVQERQLISDYLYSWNQVSELTGLPVTSSVILGSPGFYGAITGVLTGGLIFPLLIAFIVYKIKKKRGTLPK